MIHIWQTLVLAAGLFASAACRADGAAIAQTGAGASVPACQTCHGSAGEGIAQAGFPRLANLGAAYLQRQLAAFADGSRGNAVMTPIAKALSATDSAAVSAYYAGLPAPTGQQGRAATGTGSAPPAAQAAAQPAAPPEAAPPASASVGATLATRGRWADKLPACDQCHGPGGRGVGGDFPAIAGQGAAYLTNQLTAWKTGARPPGPMGLMAQVAKKLSDDEVRAVARHYAAMPARATP